jgi:hypothetical protein
MIINSILGSRQASNIVLTSNDLFKVTNVSPVTINVLYYNVKGLGGRGSSYFEGQEIDSEFLNSNSQFTFQLNVSEIGMYDYIVIFSDIEGTSKKINLKLFFGYSNGEFLFSEVGDYLELAGYNSSNKYVFIPNVYEGKIVKRIKEGAFFDNDIIEEVVIPSSIESIGSTAFFSCSALKKVTINRDLPPTLEASNIFDPYNQLSLLKIYVPALSVDLYKSAQNWNEYANNIFPIEQ